MTQGLVIQIVELEQDLPERQLQVLLLRERVIQLLLSNGAAEDQDLAKPGPPLPG